MIKINESRLKLNDNLDEILEYENLRSSILSILNGKTLTEEEIVESILSSPLYEHISPSQIDHCIRQLHRKNIIRPKFREYQRGNKNKPLNFWGLVDG